MVWCFDTTRLTGVTGRIAFEIMLFQGHGCTGWERSTKTENGLEVGGTPNTCNNTYCRSHYTKIQQIEFSKFQTLKLYFVVL